MGIADTATEKGLENRGDAIVAAIADDDDDAEEDEEALTAAALALVPCLLLIESQIAVDPWICCFPCCRSFCNRAAMHNVILSGKMTSMKGSIVSGVSSGAVVKTAG